MSIYDHFSEAERALLQARAERAAKPLRSGEADSQLSALIVTTGAEAYALPVESVLAVYEAAPVVPVPCTPPFVAGITNIRGHILPVLDLSALLNGHSQWEGDNAALVVVTANDFSAALRVERIGSVQPIPIVNAIPANLDVTHSAYVKGFFPDGAVLLDLAAMLSDPALIVNELI
jgi:purine-binding chemotaxis protein CheW